MMAEFRGHSEETSSKAASRFYLCNLTSDPAISLFEVCQLAEDLKALVNFFPRQILESLRTEAFHRK